MEPLVTVCIPHHAGWHHLRTLLASLRKIHPTTPSFEILVVDNASRDGTCEMLSERFPEAKILHLDTNCGFAQALNQAAENSATEWLAFLNNDMRVHPKWLWEAMRAAETNQTPCVGSRIMNWDGSKTQFAGGEINLLGKGFEWGDEDCDVEEERRLFFACGGAMLIQRKLFLQAGGFDEDYEMIYEDVDLGWRLNLYGHEIRYAPQSVVYHRQHASLKKVPYSQKAVFFERNSLATIYKNLGAEMWAALMPSAMRLAVYRTKAMLKAGPDGYDQMRGVQAFFDRLPQWRVKRRHVQSLRTVSDEEILSRFFPNPTRLWAYTDRHKESLNQTCYA
ncbi:MAG: glycosyltransferase family 2 protein, partial [bacterium]